MSDWEKTKCLLCGKEAEKHTYKDGYKFQCGECPLFAVPGYWYFWIETQSTSNEKHALATYLKNHPDPKGNFQVIDEDFILHALQNMPKSTLLNKAKKAKFKYIKNRD